MKRSNESQRIPLNRLKKSPKNVRQTPHTKAHIESLARSIDVHDQIHEMVVETERDAQGEPTGFFLVNVGEGRRLAQLLRVKWGHITDDEPVRCCLNDDGNARAISLAENELREAMHPADQFVSIKQLIDEGTPLEDVAAQLSLSTTIVQRRLKLASLAPEFIRLYRNRQATLEQLMALCVSDDHARQLEVWKALPDNRRTPAEIRSALTQTEMAATDPVARFITVKAYEKAGGPVRRDLFAEDNAIYLVDRELAERLAQEKLAKRAAAVKKEGFAWVQAHIRMSHADRAAYGRVRTTTREPDQNEAVSLKDARQRLELIEAELESAELEKEDAQQEQEGAAQERTDELEAEAEQLREKIGEIEDALEVPVAEDAEIAGAIVTIDYDGKIIIDRHRIKPEDVKRSRRRDTGDSSNGSEREARNHSLAMTRRLTAYRTMALQAALTMQPDIANIALVHALVLRTFYAPGSSGETSLQLDVDSPELAKDADDIAATKAHATVTQQYKRLRALLPEARSLLKWLIEQPQAVRSELLAYCIARSINGVQSDEHRGSFDELASAAGLDMREWWTPTADGYFNGLPKGRILRAVAESVAPEMVRAMSLMKKPALAKSAEEKLAGTGWLPEVLRARVA